MHPAQNQVLHSLVNIHISDHCEEAEARSMANKSLRVFCFSLIWLGLMGILVSTVTAKLNCGLQEQDFLDLLLKTAGIVNALIMIYFWKQHTLRLSNPNSDMTRNPHRFWG